MEALRLLQQAIDYVEDHLQTQLEMDEIARAAMSSKYHFQRMFHALTGFTVSEYVRNRRLSLAAEALAGTDRKVIDIALQYGYENPEAFSRAFQRLHGVTPLAARKEGVKLKAFPRLSFQIQIKGEKEMNYRMTEQPAEIIIGKETVIGSDPMKEIPAFAEGVWMDGTHDLINDTVGRPRGSLLNGFHYDFGEDGTRRYLMGTVWPEGAAVPDGLRLLHIPVQSYAVFDSREIIPEDAELGLEVLNVWRRIYSEWFPSSQFEQAEGVCMEKYFWVDESRKESICEVWIPVKRKE